jgi:hypothetical protein
MRRIPLKTVELMNAAGTQLIPLNYADAIIMAIKAPPGGYTVDEMAQPLAIEGAIRGAQQAGQDWVILEDTDWTWLAERLKVNRWTFASHAFEQFQADVIEQPRLLMTEVNAERLAAQ